MSPRFVLPLVVLLLGLPACAPLEKNKTTATTATPAPTATRAPSAANKAPAKGGPTPRSRTNAAPTTASGGTGAGAEAKPADEKKPDPIKPYEKVITKEAKTIRGLFAVHRIDEKIYYEIPTNELGKEFLWVSQIEKTQAGFGYGGGTQLGDRVVRWELHNKDILLRDVKYSIRAEANDSIRRAVEATSLEPVIRKFPVAAWGTNKAAVIEVSDLFLGDLAEFSAKSRVGAQGADKARSFLDGVKAFPDNIETKVLMTYSLSGGPGAFSTNAPLPLTRRDPSQSAVSVLLHHSMVRLPEQPMHPRRHDARVGFFNVAFEDYGTAEHQVEQIRYITRWRLEKTDPTAEKSEPKKPIVFYVGRGVPEKWRPWIKKGVEAWQPAFEAIGFQNAIVAKDAPSVEEDPDWDAEDARYSTLQWLPSTIENAQGPHVHDPRTGEILEADILIYHNILKLQRDWYFTQVSPLDPRAQTMPLPDELMGELLAYVVTHEVGHSLGFPHNMKASSSYTVEQLRDPQFTSKYGVEASIMDYGRFNYVAQPGDGARLIPILGPYDYFALEWGYKEFPNATNYAQEKKLLDVISARQVYDPKLRFGDPNPSVDPTQQTEDLGSDPVRATELGLKNLDRIMGFLVKASCKEGEDYELLQDLYSQTIAQRDRELGHVANVVGGVVMNNLWFGHADKVYTPVPSERQRAAVRFLSQNAFQTPTNLLPADILQRLEPGGAADRLISSQRRLLSVLLDDNRNRRMAENAPRTEGGPYVSADLLRDLHDGICGEFDAAPTQVDLYRRNLQRVFVELLGTQANRTDTGSDLPAAARAELRRLLDLVKKSVDNAKDPVTRAHLEDLSARIDRALDPRGKGQG
ncbi:MAG TPA: zinc-dependent metalloprotease [Verrucomicrobiae bacterium]|nr:zinc-dependent metalloprotease [Verrucomicrobiae bacterium]